MTPEREARFDFVLRHRQPGLTVILENIDDPHNISAVMRSCDAVGIQRIFLIRNEERKPFLPGKRSSSGAAKWLDVNVFSDITTCFTEVRASFDKIYATHLSKDENISLHELDLTENVALLFGNEKRGVSEEALALCDGNFLIPQVGMIKSLNISVACAVSLYEAYRQRDVKGMYKESSLSESGFNEIKGRWADNPSPFDIYGGGND